MVINRWGTLFLPAVVLSCSEYEIKGVDDLALGADDTGALVVDDTSGTTPLDPADLGAIQGRVCNTNGGDWVVGADVYISVDSDGDGSADYRIETSTDADGYFILEDVPMGTHTVYVEKGVYDVI